MEKAITICLVIVGLINLAPVLGIISTRKLESAYAITLGTNDLVILMRHRALLFGILGVFILLSAFAPAYQLAAMAMAGASMVGFALIVVSIGGYNKAIGSVLMIDIVGIIFLLAAVLLKYFSGAS